MKQVLRLGPNWTQKLPPGLRIFIGVSMLLIAVIGVCIDQDLFVPSEGMTSRGPATGSPILMYVLFALLGGGFVYYAVNDLRAKRK